MNATKRYALRWTWTKDGSTFQTPFIYRSLAGAQKAADEAREGGHCKNVEVVER